jgi:acyl-CoA thioesterase FadM
MLDRYFPLEHQIKAGYSPVVLETHIQYRKAIRMFDGPIGRISNYHPIRIPTELRAMFAGLAREGPPPRQKTCVAACKGGRSL